MSGYDYDVDRGHSDGFIPVPSDSDSDDRSGSALSVPPESDWDRSRDERYDIFSVSEEDEDLGSFFPRPSTSSSDGDDEDDGLSRFVPTPLKVPSFHDEEDEESSFLIPVCSTSPSSDWELRSPGSAASAAYGCPNFLKRKLSGDLDHEIEGKIEGKLGIVDEGFGENEGIVDEGFGENEVDDQYLRSIPRSNKRFRFMASCDVSTLKEKTKTLMETPMVATVNKVSGYGCDFAVDFGNNSSYYPFGRFEYLCKLQDVVDRLSKLEEEQAQLDLRRAQLVREHAQLLAFRSLAN